jgi:hypothetical protein
MDFKMIATPSAASSMVIVKGGAIRKLQGQDKNQKLSNP